MRPLAGPRIIETPILRILYYNWVDYLDDEKRGGGVTVYQKNLIAALRDTPGVEVRFLSSGISYDAVARKPRWEALRHGPPQDRDIRYEIVNSGVLSPSHLSFGDPAQVSHPATEATFVDFVAATGPYDVIHFNNLEGIPVEVLGALKARFPMTRIVMAWHNYYPVCPQVNLWHQERRCCTDYANGENCVSCIPIVYPAAQVRVANSLAYRLKRAGVRPGSRMFDIAFRWILGAGMRAVRLSRRVLGSKTRAEGAALPAPGPAGVVTTLTPLARPDGAPFVARRKAMLAALNRHCDRVLCVSDAVRDLAVSFGIDPDIAVTSYIGTQQAQAFEQTAPRPVPARDDGTLTLAYLGYMRHDKGFFFLLEALEDMPAALAARLRLVVAARKGDPVTMSRLAVLSGRLAELRYANGYTHDNLDDLLADVDVGLVPVLWHDNLPQVAIEMHARHIPLLCADLGGAQELAGCPDMIFKARDAAAFETRLRAILDGQVDFDAYWQGARAPVSMEGHVADLLEVYRGQGRAGTPEAV